MPRFKGMLPNFFGGSKDTSSKAAGRLETDALPVDDAADRRMNRRDEQQQQSAASTPTASADMTAAVVRELSDPNYNSLEVAQLSDPNYNSLEVAELPMNGGAGANDSDASMAVANMHDNTLAASNSNTTTNTMNVHNAQQQLVMQFSNVNKLHIGSVFNFNNSISAGGGAGAKGAAAEAAPAAGCGAGDAMPGVATPSKRAGTQRVSKTTSIVSMMQSTEEPNHRMLDAIATHLGEGWKEVMRKLDHSEGQIEQALIDHQMHGGIREVIYQLLLQWVRNADDGAATLGNITTLLWECNHRDCVQRMKLVWKAEVKRKTSR